MLLCEDARLCFFGVMFSNELRVPVAINSSLIAKLYTSRIIARLEDTFSTLFKKSHYLLLKRRSRTHANGDHTGVLHTRSAAWMRIACLLCMLYISTMICTWLDEAHLSPIDLFRGDDTSVVADRSAPTNRRHDLETAATACSRQPGGAGQSPPHAGNCSAFNRIIHRALQTPYMIMCVLSSH